MSFNRKVLQTNVSDYDRLSAGLLASIVLSALFSFVALTFWLSMLNSQTQDLLLIDPPPDQPWQLVEFPIEFPIEIALEEELPELKQDGFDEEFLIATEVPSTIYAKSLGTDGLSDLEGIGTREKRKIRPVVPETTFERWKVQIPSSDRETYLNILDYFKIDIGVVERLSDRIVLITNISREFKLKSTSRSEEQRVYFRHTQSDLIRWDKELVIAAGVDHQDSILVQFYPSQLVQQLVSLEISAAADKGIAVNEIKQTKFAVRRSATGFEFFVESIIEMK